MSNSRRDKDYHFLRNSEKYLGEWDGQHILGLKGIENTPENSEKDKQFHRVWSKYGLKSMVGNKRRRCTTRKSNQKFKQTMSQVRRAKLKAETIKIIENETLYES